MKKQNSYLKKSLSDFPENTSVSSNIIDMAFYKYNSEKHAKLLVLYVFGISVLFTLFQSLTKFFVSAEIFSLFSNRTEIILTLFRFIAEYTTQYGPYLAVLGLLSLVIAIYQNKNFLK